MIFSQSALRTAAVQCLCYRLFGRRSKDVHAACLGHSRVMVRWTGALLGFYRLRHRSRSARSHTPLYMTLRPGARESPPRAHRFRSILETTMNHRLASRACFQWSHAVLHMSRPSRLCVAVGSIHAAATHGPASCEHMSRAHISCAHMSSAHMRCVHMSCAHISCAHMSSAHMSCAHMSSAHV